MTLTVSRTALALVLALSAPAAGQELRPARSKPEFRVLEVRGTAQVWRAGSRDASVLAADSPLATRDQIETTSGAYVRIGLQDGSQIEIFPGSRVELGVARASWLRALDLVIGQIRVVIERIGGRPNPYSFGTPTAVLGVRGTVFQVSVDASATLVAVEEGVVHVANILYPADGVLVKAGYRTLVRPNELPVKPERFAGNGTDRRGIAAKHGRAMAQAGGGTMRSGSGGMGNMGGTGTMGTMGTGTMHPGSVPAGSSGAGGMPGMGGKKKDPKP